MIKQDPVNPALLFLGTDTGVYVTFDGGSTWNAMTRNLPVTFIHDLVIHPRDGILVAATHGRGFYTLDITSIRGFGVQDK